MRNSGRLKSVSAVPRSIDQGHARLGPLADSECAHIVQKPQRTCPAMEQGGGVMDVIASGNQW